MAATSRHSSGPHGTGASLEELKKSIGSNDMVRTADLLAYEVSAEFDSQVAILQLLAEGNL